MQCCEVGDWQHAVEQGWWCRCEVLNRLAFTSVLCEVPLLYNYTIKLMRLLSSYFGTVYLKIHIMQSEKLAPAGLRKMCFRKNRKQMENTVWLSIMHTILLRYFVIVCLIQFMFPFCISYSVWLIASCAAKDLISVMVSFCNLLNVTLSQLYSFFCMSCSSSVSCTS